MVNTSQFIFQFWLQPFNLRFTLFIPISCHKYNFAMDNLSKIPKGSLFCYSLLLIVLFHQFQDSHAQQSYVDNRQLNCFVNDSTTLGFVCNAARSCRTYLTFRTTTTYNSSVTIAKLLNIEATDIARINNISDEYYTIPTDTLVIVPATCSCSGHYYQHNSSYVLQDMSESYYTVANVTYQGLTTCQSLMAQNSYNYKKLKVGMRIKIPLRCACPTQKQINSGYNYLLSYLVTLFDYFESIVNMFDADLQSIFFANELSSDKLIFPFTPLLIPLKSEPTHINTPNLSPPSPPKMPVLRPSVSGLGNSTKKWAFLSVGIGIGLLVLFGLFIFLLWFFCHRSNLGTPHSRTEDNRIKKVDPESVDGYKSFQETECKSWPEEVKTPVQSFKVYKYEELQIATGSFAEGNRIKGSVFLGTLNGNAAVEMMKGNLLEEINVIRKINHSNIIRLSGVCLHEGNTYAVREYAEGGSLRDLLNDPSKRIIGNDQSQQEHCPSSVKLSWKHRVQVAYDVADALNYLHNFVNPPYIHRNLNSSNILLDACLRAKLSNFGLSSSSDGDNQNEDESGSQLHHVKGTQDYIAPEYIENGLVTPKLDVFAFGVVILELLSGRYATCSRDSEANDGDELLHVKINHVFDGENIREKLRDFLDPCLRRECPLGMAYSMAQVARKCVANDLNFRPTIAEVFITMSNILSATLLYWDPSE